MSVKIFIMTARLVTAIAFVARSERNERNGSVITQAPDQSTDLLYRLNDFSLDDKQLLRSCWHQLSKHKEEIAVEIFILIFKQCPETKKLFYFIDDDQHGTSSKKMKDDNALQFHALRFIQVSNSF